MGKKILFSIIFLSALVTAQGQISLASNGQTSPSNYTLLEPLPCVRIGANTPCTPGTMQESINFENYIQYVFNLLIALASAAAVFMIVWGGFQTMTSDAWFEKKEGKNKITNALLGLVLILCSYLILKTIDPRLVAIPKTLVEPLKISATNERLTVIEAIMASSVDLKAKNAEYKEQISQLEKDVGEISAQREKLSKELKDLKSAGDTEKIPELQMNIAKLDQQLSDKYGHIYYITGKAFLNDAISQCAKSQTGSAILDGKVQDCNIYIKNATVNYANSIKDFSPQLGVDLNQYGKFAEAVTKINIQANIASEDPLIAEIVKSINNKVSLTPFDPITTGIGRSTINSLVDIKAAPYKSEKAKIAAQNITTIVNQYRGYIKDPEAMNLLITQSNAILKSLEGK